MREFIKIDSHRALEVGHLKEGFGTFEIRRPKGQEGCPEVAVRENLDELTLGAEEVGTWRSYTIFDHIAKKRWGLPLVDADWHAFCKAFFKGIEGEDWGELCDACKENNTAVGVKKPQEAQKTKALRKMKAAKEAGEEYYDPTREDNILGRNKTRIALWKEHLKDPTVALDKALKCVESSYWRSRPECSVEEVSCNGWRWLPPEFVGKADLGERLALLGSTEWNVPGKHGPHGELLLFLIQKEPAARPDSETFSPFFNADIRTLLFSADVPQEEYAHRLVRNCGRRKRRRWMSCPWSGG